VADQREQPAADDRRGEDAQAQHKKPSTTPAEERGERLDYGKTVARGGKTGGHVPGAHNDRGT
jgi:hypothetical protein